MLAFHAPPEAVIMPVTKNGKIPGRMSLRQRSQPRMPKTLAASFRSVGMAMAPAITLKRMYHCVPSKSKTMEPTPKPPPTRILSSQFSVLSSQFSVSGNGSRRVALQARIYQSGFDKNCWIEDAFPQGLKPGSFAHQTHG